MRKLIKKIKAKIVKFLLWTQKWTKTDMLYLAKGGFWLSFGQITHAVLSFITTIVLANILPPDIYGSYKYIIAIVALLSITTLNGMNIATIRAVARGYEGNLPIAIKTKIKWGIIGGIASAILGSYYLLNNNLSLGSIFLIASIFVPFMETLNIYTSYLNGKKKYKTFSFLSQLSTLINVTILISTILLTKNIFIISLIYFSSNTLTNLILTKITIKKYPPNSKVDNSTISYGKKLSFINIIKIVATKIDSILIFTFLGAPEVAIYTITTKPINEIRTLLKHLNILALPKLSKRDWPELKNSLPIKMNKLYIIIIPIIIIWVFSSPIVFKFLFPKYFEFVLYSQIFALDLLFFPRSLITTAFEAQADKKEVFRQNIISPSLKIGFLFLFLPLFKVWGAIIAVLLSNLLNYIYLHFVLNKKSNSQN